MTEITYGTIEDYGELDWQFGATITVDDVPQAAGFNPDIQYNQNEFKAGSYYCPLYKFFSMYSSYTGVEFPKEWRYEVLQRCLSTPSPSNPNTNIIVDNVGGKLNEVVDEARRYLRAKTSINYVTLMVSMRERKDVETLWKKGYVIGTGFKVNAQFNQDKNDNCVVDKVESVEGTSGGGHALGDFLLSGKHMRVDNYFGVNKCNVYQIVPYDEFVTNGKMHFKNGYILTSLQPAKMTQAEQDQKDLETAKAEGIYTKEELLDKPVTMRQVVFIAMRLVRYIVKLLGK